MRFNGKIFWRIAVPLLILAALAAAFFADGGTEAVPTRSPEAEALSSQPPVYAAETSEPSASPEASALPDTVTQTPEPEASEESAPESEQTPEASEAPSPSPTPDSMSAAAELSCTISISCATILDNLELCDEEKRELVPESGFLLAPVTVSFSEGESVFDVLQRVCRDYSLHLEFSSSPVYDSVYIEGIGNIYEFDVGELSGWLYKVNGVFPGVSCSVCELQNGDVIGWVYTCDLGADVGSGV